MNSVFGFHCYLHGGRTTANVFRVGHGREDACRVPAAAREQIALTKHHIAQFSLVSEPWPETEMELPSSILL